MFEETLDENIDSYHKCLDDDDRSWTIKEEENCRNILQLKTMYDQTLDKMKNNRINKCHLEGIHTYDILRNPTYVQNFQYVSPNIEDRENIIKDGDDDNENNAYQSDLIKIALNLAFMTKDEVKNF